MFIIGHRGAAGIKPENTLEALRAGQQAGVDMIEFDVRLTKDEVPVLIHDSHLWRVHHLPYAVNQMTYKELMRRTAHSVNPIIALDTVLEEFSGQILLNLELKDRGSAKKIMPLVERYITKPEDWEIFLFSSFKVGELKAVRKYSEHAQLALLHHFNALRFLFFNRQINLTAVGFHRLHVNSFVISAARKLDLFTYCYTVNRPKAAYRLGQLGIDGIVTDVPDKMVDYFSGGKKRKKRR